MATVAGNHSFTELKADEVFQTLVRALPEVGYSVWKTRPIGWLIIANRDLNPGKINATFSIRPGTGADLSLSLASETLSEAELEPHYKDLLDKIVERLA